MAQELMFIIYADDLLLVMTSVVHLKSYFSEINVVTCE